MSSPYTNETPDEVKNAKGLHLITQNTPNGQAVQIFLEELKDAYGTEWTTSVIDISTNIQKSDWFLRLDPNGRIPVLVDNTQSPPFSVHETSAELFYLLKFADKEDRFGFADDLERNQALQWTFFCESTIENNFPPFRVEEKGILWDVGGICRDVRHYCTEDNADFIPTTQGTAQAPPTRAK